MPSVTDIVDDQLDELGFPVPKRIVPPPKDVLRGLGLPTVAEIVEPPVRKVIDTVKRKVT